jgi:hypothetical protein
MKWLMFALLFAATGCSVYLDQFKYVPRPGFAEVATSQPSQASPVTAYATVVGVRVDDPQDKIPPSVEIRLRVQNNGPWTVVFDPRSMDLMNGEVLRFAPPLLEGQPAVTLPPLASATVNTYFPFPQGYSPENTDLESLQLQWTVAIDGQPTSMGVNFHRWYHPYYYNDPYYYDSGPDVRFGLYAPGVVFVHRR